MKANERLMNLLPLFFSSLHLYFCFYNFIILYFFGSLELWGMGNGKGRCRRTGKAFPVELLFWF